MGDGTADAAMLRSQVAELTQQLEVERESNTNFRRQVQGLSEERQALQDQVSQNKGHKTLPLSPIEIQKYQKRFDGLVLHSKQMLADIFELALSNMPDDDSRGHMEKAQSRVTHEWSWLRDNGAGLLQIVLLGGTLYSFSNNRG